MIDFDRLVKWSAEKPSRNVDIAIQDGEVKKVFLYDYMLIQGAHYIIDGKKQKELAAIDLEALHREKLRKAYEEGKKLFEAS